MADWDFESALKDYFGASTEDGDAPPGAGSATFSAPSGWDFDKVSNDYSGGFRAPRSEPTQGGGGNGWDFDKALNDYFGGVNGYVAPRGYESPDGWTPRNAPWEFSPPSEPPPPPSDYDQAVWFNALQRRHEAWDQAREQQELLRAPVSQLMTPQEQAAWAEAYRRSQAHIWTPEQMTGFGYGFRRAEEQGDLGAWLERFKQYEAEKAAPAQEQPYQSELYQFLNRAQEAGGNALDWLNRQFPNASRYPGKPYGMTDEEYERQIEQNRQIIGSVANTLGQANEALDQVPILGGFKELLNRALNLYPQTGGFLQQQAAERPEQTAWLLHSSPATELLAKQLFNLNLPEPNLQRAIQEARTNPLTPEQVREALAKAPEVYREKTHPLVQGGLSFFEPGYWALGLAGRGLLSGGTSRLEKLTELEELRGDLATIKPKDYGSRWPNSLSQTVGRKVTGPADLTDAELDKVLGVYRDHASKTLPPLSAEEKAARQTIRRNIDWLHREAAPYRKLEFTPENWRAEFGEKGIVQTPMGEFNVGKDLYDKLVRLNRTDFFGLVKPTLQDPLMVLRDTDRSLIFVKTFAEDTKTTRFVAIAVDRGGINQVISSHHYQPYQLERILKHGELLYDRRATSLGTIPPTLR